MALFRGAGGSGEATGGATVSAVTEQAQIATTKANEASTSASNAASSASAASSSASTASTAATSASASAVTATTKAIEASGSASTASTAATNAQTAQTAAETAQTAAETAETNAETAETNAESAQTAAEAARDLAEGYRDTALSHKNDAETAQTAAETAQGLAETAQTAAETAQGLAEDARDTAVAAQEAIDGLYLGAQASNPTVDLNGDPVTAGDWYFNTTSNITFIYDGSNWNSASPELVNDTTPQLGGTLDANGNTIDMGTNTITDTKVGQWDTAFGWGDHSTEGYLTSVAFGDLTSTPTTLSGYGITDAATSAQGTLADSAVQPSDNISTLTNDSGYITGYTVTEGDVTAHQAALSITESQISDLQSYLTAETNDLTAAVTWANVPDANITQSSVTQHQAALSIATTQLTGTIDGGTY